MFETSVVREGAMQSRSRFSLLTVSLIAHSAVIVGAVSISVASVEFPAVAPDEVMNAPVFMPIAVPPPLGNPDGGAPPQPRATPPPPQQQAPAQITAPSNVPDEVPALEAPSNGTGETSGESAGTGTVPGPVGVPWGVDGGLGDMNAPPLGIPIPEPEQKIYTVGEVSAPVLLKRVEPAYPQALVRVKMAGKVHVRCVIDKNGRVRDPQIIFATMPPFAESTVRALEQWRYKPASLNGNAVECYLDVMVDFGIR